MRNSENYLKLSENILNWVSDHLEAIRGILSKDRNADITSLYQNFAEDAPSIICMINLRNEIIFVNGKFEQLTGYSRTEIIGKHWAKTGVYSIESMGTLMGMLTDQGVKLSTKAVEMPLKCKDGRTIWVNAIGDVFTKRDSIVGYQIIAQDITNIKELEMCFLESEKRDRLIAENVADVIWTIDMNEQVTYVSPSITDLLGYSVEEAMSKSSEDIYTPDSLKVARKILHDELKKRRKGQKDLLKSKTLRLNLYRKDSSIIPVEVNFSFLYDVHEKPIGILAIARDISSTISKEEQLKQNYDREKRLREELEVELTRRAEFTRFLVHELKTPLTAVIASVELLVDEKFEEPFNRLMENINRSSFDLNKRINELLEISRGEMGILRIKLRRVAPLRLLKAIANKVSPIIAKDELSLSLVFPRSLPYIIADKERIQQVVLNLLDNAMKFTPVGGKITIRAMRKGTFLIVQVQDTGRGLAKDEQERVFQSAHRLESDRERFVGLGLGLLLSKRIVELHKGQIWVESKLGEGSTFSFSVPIFKAKSRGKIQASD